jgi:aminoglycoside 6'-N-acetyltransferase
MMEEAFKLCFLKHGASSIVIDPLQSNQRAIAFYRRLGFKEVGPRRFGDDDCLVMSIGRAEFETFGRE